MARFMDHDENMVYRAVVTTTFEAGQDPWHEETYTQVLTYGPYLTHGGAQSVASAKANSYLNRGIKSEGFVEESVVAWVKSD
jgi:hypothetical protein